MQSVDVLFHCIRAYFIDRLFRQSQHDIVAVRKQSGFRKHLLQLRQGLLYIGGILQRHSQTIFSLMHRTGTDFFAAQFAADVAGVTFKRFLHRGFHVYLHGEMHTTAQVQTQEHRIGFNFRHPLRAVRQKVERGNIAFAQSIFDDITRFQLRFSIFKTHFQRVIDNEHTVSLNTCALQRRRHFRLGLLIDNDGLSVGRYFALFIKANSRARKMRRLFAKKRIIRLSRQSRCVPLLLRFSHLGRCRQCRIARRLWSRGL